MYIYEMNREIKAEVDTPVGKTEPFVIKEVVRQGTIYGPTLCSITTDRINKMGNDEPVVIGDVIVRCPIFVDDIAGIGKKGDIEKVAEKMKSLEITKKFVFNNKKNKSEILVIRNIRMKRKRK